MHHSATKHPIGHIGGRRLRTLECERKLSYSPLKARLLPYGLTSTFLASHTFATVPVDCDSTVEDKIVGIAYGSAGG